MRFEAQLSAGSSSSCFEEKQAQVSRAQSSQNNLFIAFIESFTSQLCFSHSVGDTMDRLSTLHELLAEAADWPRVLHCAQVIPVLLHIFFNTVTKVKRLNVQHRLYVIIQVFQSWSI